LRASPGSHGHMANRKRNDAATVAELEDRGVSDPEARVNEAAEHMRNSDP
jgi:hypothetical protein